MQSNNAIIFKLEILKMLVELKSLWFRNVNEIAARSRKVGQVSILNPYPSTYSLSLISNRCVMCTHYETSIKVVIITYLEQKQKSA